MRQPNQIESGQNDVVNDENFSSLADASQTILVSLQRLVRWRQLYRLPKALAVRNQLFNSLGWNSRAALLIHRYVCAALSLNEATKPNRVRTEWRREWREMFCPSPTLHGRYSYIFNDWSDGGNSTAVQKRLLLRNGLCVCCAKSELGNRTKSSLDRMTSWMTRKNSSLPTLQRTISLQRLVRWRWFYRRSKALALYFNFVLCIVYVGQRLRALWLVEW